MTNTSSARADVRDFLSSRGIDSLTEDREPNPDFITKPGERFSWREHKRKLKEDDTIDLGTAENTLMIPKLREQIAKQFPLELRDTDFQYGGPGGSETLRDLLSKFVNSHFSLPDSRQISMEEVVTTAGVYAALEQISYAVANPGDGILIGRPLYGGFTKGFTFSRSKVKVIAVDFEDNRAEEPVDPFSEAALARYKNEFERSNDHGTRVKALVICNPHNPLGRCFSKEVLEKLILLCCDLGIHLISDEIYAMSHYQKAMGEDDIPFTSVLALKNLHVNHDKFVHCLYGMSKDFCSSGVRLGAIITRCAEIRNTIITNSFLSWVSSGADVMWSCILRDKNFLATFFEENQKALSKAYQFLAKKLDENGINYDRRGNAGLFVWINLTYALQSPPPKDATDGAREKYILDKLSKAPGGLRISSGLGFRTEKLGWFRMVFSRPERDLEGAVKRIVDRLGTPKDPKH